MGAIKHLYVNLRNLVVRKNVCSVWVGGRGRPDATCLDIISNHFKRVSDYCKVVSENQNFL